MGDGGVTLAPSQHAMESVFSSKSFNSEKMMRKGEVGSEKGRNLDERARGKELERRRKGESEEWQNGELEKGEFVPERSRNGEVELGEFIPEKPRKVEIDSRWSKEEVEKGEFVLDNRWKKCGEREKLNFYGSGRGRKVELEKGEFVPGKSRKEETDKGEFNLERRGKWEVEKKGGEGERLDSYGSGRGRKKELERGEFVLENNYRSKGEVEKKGREGEQMDFFGLSRGQKIEMEKKSEFVPENCPSKREVEKKGGEGDRSDFVLGRGRKMELEKGEFIPENNYRRKGGGRSENDHMKRSSSSNWDFKKSSRGPEEEAGQFKYEHNNGKSRDKETYSENWPKRHCMESESSGRKYHQEFIDHSRSKSRRKSEENNPPRTSYPERSYGNPASLSSSRVSSSSRHPSSSRHHEPSLSSRGSHEKQGHRDHRDRTPSHSDRSPLERARHHGHRDRTPSHSDRSPVERTRHHDHRERSPHDRGWAVDHWEQNKKSGTEKQQISKFEERPGRRESGGKESFKNSSVRQSNNNSSTCSERSGADDKSSKKKVLQNSTKESSEPPLPPPPPPPPPPPTLPLSPLPQLENNGVLDELPSMEEDMDICDTPPHFTVTANPKPGKWFYLDHFGIEQGPSKLDDLKRLVEEGILLSDHLIKHSDSDRWVTVENATSPLVQLNLPSIVSDAVTEMVCPPEAPGNLLVDAGDLSLDSSTPVLQHELESGDEPVAEEFIEDFSIDERVEALLNGYTVIHGNELETIGEALNTTFEHVEWENWVHSEGFTRFQARDYELSGNPRDEGIGRALPREATETRPGAPPEEYPILIGSSSDWFAGRWSCKGGDWKRNDEAGQDRSSKKKIVLNQGYPLCQMPKCGHEDPRWYRRDDLYYPSRFSKLEIPPWGFSLSEDNSDSSNDTNKSMIPRQNKPPIPRGVKGTILPVVRINACVVRDHGSFEPRMKVKGSERHAQRSTRSHLVCGERGLFSEGPSNSKKPHELDLQSLHKCRTALNIPRDHVCTVDELSFDLGDWYYLDGAGHEHGPLLYSELQDLVAKGTLLQNSSVFRKVDNVWLPVTASESARTEKQIGDASGNSSITANGTSSVSHSFHGSHPQFIGYTRGKLHELVMKSYKNREFAAAINEVLDPWISAKQPKKEMDKHFPFNSSITRSSVILAHDLSGDKLWRSEDTIPEMYGDSSRSGKRARLLFDESEGDSEIEEDLLVGPKNDPSFDDLCGEAAFVDYNGTSSEPGYESWGLLNGHILARVFHFMRTDMKSLISSAVTCKGWNLAVKFYKNLCRHVDLSSAGPNCTDSMFRSIMSGYEKKNLTSVTVAGCSNISACVLEEVLQLFPCISSIDIRGCSHFKDLVPKFQNVKWIKSSSCKTKSYEESYSRIRSLKHITEKNYSVSKAFRGLGGHPDDFGEPGDVGNNEFSLVDRKDSSSHPFKQGVYKRARLLDARKSSAVLSRDAQMRRWLHRKSGNGYRKMEEYIAVNLKDIMKENTFEFFIPKVAEIEDRMRNGYYVRHGLGFVKDDISRMCRDAFKAKNRGDAEDMKRIIMLFIRLAKSLEGNPRLTNERDEMIKTIKDDSETGFYSSTSKYKKKQNKIMSEKKGMNRINNTSSANGGTDSFDHEIKRSLSTLKKRDMDSDSETSDDHENDFSEEDDRGEGETTASDTESDSDLLSGGGTGGVKGNGDFMVDDTLDSITDDREWGARMTKASLVPPVTRKYEVIDSYLVIADEEEVKRKMRVALPDDYSEKLLAQKSGMEESDMEIPEVKQYKPRKMLGVEVLEQEVYGIDPFTHNLLLDSMPEEPEWLLVDKHKFIEEVLLRSLNKQIRHFTGTAKTPMVYPLRPVVEEIQKIAEEGGDKRSVKLCQTILKAMQSRPDDNYVAYRKGLGVVCNREEGFGEDDFVVEFLGEVYPAWKWFEKQDGIRSLQKNNQDPAPEFYNIYLERPKGDRDGYDLVVVDAMHKANYASRICHSCRPNCEAKVTAVDGQYQIGIYTVRPIGYGEEITFDYNSVTESKEEYEASVCLCGSQICRGSYLNLTGEGAFQKVLKECHGVLDRHKLMLEACEANSVSQEDYIDLGRAGLGTCLLAGLPDWLVAYSAHLVRFIDFERTKLPQAILKHNLEEKKKFFADICLEDEKSDAEVQAEGVYNARLQNMALTLDKVRYVMRRVFGDPKEAPPPLQKLSPETVVSVLWKGEGSLVEELLQSMVPHMEADLLNDLKSKIHDHDPSGSDNVLRELRKSLLWLRDELRNLPCTSKCRHDAAADLIHIYAYTKYFYKVMEYKTVKSPPVYISPLDLGPKYVDKMGLGFQEYCKTNGENYCLGQLIYWHSQTNADPDCRLARARRGCLSLPDVSSFYGKSHKPVHERVYDSRTLRFMLSRMERQPQRPWPKDRIWVFKSSPRFFGSPMLDALLNNCPLDKEMMQWLKSRPTVYQGMWDG